MLFRTVCERARILASISSEETALAIAIQSYSQDEVNNFSFPEEAYAQQKVISLLVNKHNNTPGAPKWSCKIPKTTYTTSKDVMNSLHNPLDTGPASKEGISSWLDWYLHAMV
jgi:hypothetical protein